MKKTVTVFIVFVFLSLSAAFSAELAYAESAWGDQIVYITRYGEKFHRQNCRTLARSKYIYEITLREAENRGYGPCKVCRPLQAEQSIREKMLLAYRARCVEVIDGDTLRVAAENGKETKIRLYGIDCPEKGQLFGAAAKKAVQDLVLNKQVNVVVQDTDKYGRSAALVYGDDFFVQEQLLKQGLTWVYPEYCRIALCDGFYRLEEQARSVLAGLWKYPNIPPWQWRRM